LITALNTTANSPTFWVMLCDDCTPPSSTNTANYHGALNNWSDAGNGNTFIQSNITWQSAGGTYLDNLADKDTTRICLIKRQDDGAGGFENVLLGCSDLCFKKVIDTCNTSLFNYRSNDDSFCFYYAETDFTNVVRLPILLRNPQMKKEQKGYQKSNGQFVKLSERISKTYNLEVDNLPEIIHDKIAVMLAHDSVIITNQQFNAETIYCEDDYVINWSEDVVAFNLATASTKVYISKDSCLTNSNC
jgi:hypothetical protein